jgi:murein DD-endopeptidase MepM/ murein hydrolase activator NlpD
MPAENIHHRKEKRRYTFIFVSGDESKKTHTFSASRLWLAVTIVSTIVLIALSVYALIVFTPIRTWIPIHNAELEQRYGKQVVEIQDRLRILIREMSILKEYNSKLRNALGDKITMSDSITNNESGLQAVDLVAEKDITQKEKPSNQIETKEDQKGVMIKEAAVTESVASVSAGIDIDLPFTMPASGFFTNGFDPNQNHFGIDIAGKQGSSVIAAAAGDIVFAGWTFDYGFTVIIAHDRGYVTVYKHNQEVVKTTGTSVKRGELIAFLGNTGETSSGPHLHFEVWKNGIPENPINYLLITQ